MGKKSGVQKRTWTFSIHDPIAVLELSESLKTACNYNGNSEGAAVWYLRFYLTGRAHDYL